MPPVSLCLTAKMQMRSDAETETLIPTIGGVFDVAHSLSAEGFDASEDGAGRGTPIVPVQTAYSIMPMNSGTDYKARETDVAQPLMAGGPVGGNQGGDFIVAPIEQPIVLMERGRGGESNLEFRQDGTANAILTPNGGRGGFGVGAIAFSAKDYGNDALDDLSPTLRSMNAAESHANGGGQVAVAIQAGALRENPASGPDAVGVQEGHAYTLEARAEVQAVAFAQNQRDELREMDVAGALAAEPGMKQQTYLAEQWAVRRLTPVECERLQGFPDGWTNIAWRGKSEAPDGPRYKAIGNSMACNVMRWIGMRIDWADKAAGGQP